MGHVVHHCGRCGHRISPLFSTTVRCGTCGATNEVGVSYVVGTFVLVFVLLFALLVYLSLDWFSSYRYSLLVSAIGAVGIPVLLLFGSRRIRSNTSPSLREDPVAAAIAKHALQQARARAAAQPPPPPTPEAAGLLVFTDPPHGAIDEGALASTMGWTAADARLFFASPLPTVIAKVPDEPSAERLSKSLDQLGVKTAVVPEAKLSQIPAPRPCSSFVIDDDGFGYEGGLIPWSSIRVAFVVSERKFEVRQSAREKDLAAKARENRRAADGAFVPVGMQVGLLRDAFLLEQESRGSRTELVDTKLHLGGFDDRGQAVRLVLTQQGLRYEGLGQHRQKSAAMNWKVLLDLIEHSTAGKVSVDHRAEKASPKPGKPAAQLEAFLCWKAGLVE